MFLIPNNASIHFLISNCAPICFFFFSESLNVDIFSHSELYIYIYIWYGFPLRKKGLFSFILCIFCCTIRI